MSDRITRQAARLTLECGHTVIYDKPWPKSGEHGWCQRCQEFRLALVVMRIDIDRDTVTGYNKKANIVVYQSWDSNGVVPRIF